jgi:hypothetical protein
MKKAKPLRPFDYEDKMYFEGVAQSSIGEKLDGLEIKQRFLSGCLKANFNKNDADDCSTRARLTRIQLRDTQVSIKLTMKHLEVIEATGEWK